MSKHVTGWNLFVGETMKHVADLKQVALLWATLSVEEKAVWSARANLRNLSQVLDAPKAKKHLHAYNYFIKGESPAVAHIKDPKERFKALAILWGTLTPAQKQAWLPK
jgi:hypothetical protein